MRRQKHSRLSASIAARRFADAEFEKENERLRKLGDRLEQGEEVPASEWSPREKAASFPREPLAADLFHRFSSLADALKEWRVQRPPKDKGDFSKEEQEEAERIAEEAPHRRNAADKILMALESHADEVGSNYDAASEAIDEWRKNAATSSDTARRRVAEELLSEIHPLLWAYRDPVVFFCEIAPKLWPTEFALRESKPPAVREPGLLERAVLDLGSRRHVVGRALRTWGPGVLLNPALHASFVRASSDPAEFGSILEQADEKGRYQEGPPPGATKGRAKPGRPRKPFGKLGDKSKERRLYRDGRRKRKSE